MNFTVNIPAESPITSTSFCSLNHKDVTGCFSFIGAAIFNNLVQATPASLIIISLMWTVPKELPTKQILDSLEKQAAVVTEFVSPNWFRFLKKRNNTTFERLNKQTTSESTKWKPAKNQEFVLLHCLHQSPKQHYTANESLTRTPFSSFQMHFL